MAVKNYDHNALVQRMTDVYVDTVRYHGGHWQALNGHHRSYGTGLGVWANVPDDMIFITNLYQELQRDLLNLEQGRPALYSSVQSISLTNFITAAQTAFTA